MTKRTIEYIRILALLGVYVGAYQIVFDLTTICVLPRDSIKFVVAQFSLERFRKALERYTSDCGGYPNPVVGIKALVVDPGIKGWNGPYTKQPLTDPWQRPYIYEISNALPVVRSLGADGKPGGDMFDGDLSSQNPFAPPCESKFHAARRFFRNRVAPWLVLTTSLYVWFRAHPRCDIGASDPAENHS
jgi:type II secretion system protein G